MIGQTGDVIDTPVVRLRAFDRGCGTLPASWLLPKWHPALVWSAGFRPSRSMRPLSFDSAGFLAGGGAVPPTVTKSRGACRFPFRGLSFGASQPAESPRLTHLA